MDTWTAEQRKEAADRCAKPIGWLKTIFHACQCEGHATCLTRNCASTRAMMYDLMSLPRQQLPKEHTPFHRLLCHYEDCKNTACRICVPVLREISGSSATRYRTKKAGFSVGENCDAAAMDKADDVRVYRRKKGASTPITKAPYDSMPEGLSATAFMRTCSYSDTACSISKHGSHPLSTSIAQRSYAISEPDGHAIIQQPPQLLDVMVMVGQSALASLMRKSFVSAEQGCDSCKGCSGSGSNLWHHILFECDPPTCKQIKCQVWRRILCHMLKCQRPDCAMCGKVRACFRRGLDMMDEDSPGSVLSSPDALAELERAIQSLSIQAAF